MSKDLGEERDHPADLALPELRAAAWKDLATGRVVEACARAESILEKWPDDREATEIHAVALAQSGRLTDALTKLDDLVGRGSGADAAETTATPAAPRKDGLPPRIHAHRANVLAMLGRVDDAIAAYRLVIEVEPANRSALLNLSSLELENGAWPDAGEHLRALLELDPDNPAALYTMGRLRQRIGEPVEAEAAYRRSIELDPGQANAWNNLGNVHKDLGRFEDAARCYESALAIDPDRPALRHLVSALRGQTTEGAEPEYVRQLFDRYANQFETDLVEKLDYHVPRTLIEFIREHLEPTRRFPRALDLGCGTGLLGREFKPWCDQLHGVDLSQKMLDQAARTGLYDRLTTGEIVEFLRETEERFDLIAATDVLVYFGDLDALWGALCQRLTRNAWIAFSAERLNEGTYQILPSGRYAHSRQYVLESAGRHGLVAIGEREIGTRRERGEMVTGDIYLWTATR